MVFNESLDEKNAVHNSIRTRIEEEQLEMQQIQKELNSIILEKEKTTDEGALMIWCLAHNTTDEQ